jgi:CheY-like chemotaxis protein
VTLLLPRDTQAGEEDQPSDDGELQATISAQGNVLVVEDEPAVRGLVMEALGELGLQTIEAIDGPGGLEVLQSGVRIDLLVTDVGLPGLNGRQLADAGRLARPDLKILFMTGYAHKAAVGNGMLETGMELITKPFTIDQLSSKIRTMLEHK